MEEQGVTFFDILTRGTYGFFLFAFLIVIFILAVLWIILPFAVFKIKAILGDTNIQLMRANKYLMSIEGYLKELSKKAEATDSITPPVSKIPAVLNDDLKTADTHEKAESSDQPPSPEKTIYTKRQKSPDN